MSQSFMSAEVEAPLAMSAPPGILVSALSEVLRCAVGLLGNERQQPPAVFVAIARPRARETF